MKHLLTLVALLISSLAMGQDHAEYPFPYNPDGNADGYIGLNDMLDLLSVYGQQYPESFYSDSTRAILDLGDMTYQECNQQAFMAGRSWRVLSQDDFYYWYNHFLTEGQEMYEAGGFSGTNFYIGAWIRLNDGDRGSYSFKYGPSYQYDYRGESYNLDAGNSWYNSQKFDGSERFYVTSEGRCILSTQTLPSIEYVVMYDENSVADSLSNGWKPLGGFNGSQTLWRYAD